MNQQLNIDLSNSTEVLSPSGGKLFGAGVILRKVSKFLMGTSDDVIIPIQVFYDLETKEIMEELLPPDIRKLYQTEENTIIE